MKYNDNGEYKDIYIKTFDTLPVGTEVDYDGSVVPDGWSEVEDGWVSLNNTIKYKKIGNIVTITGYSANTTSLSIGDYNTIGTLPTNFRPKNILYAGWNEIGVDYTNTLKVGLDGTIALFSTKNTAYWAFTITYVL